jgi:inorganic phosphate transporter, PiT family
MGVETILFILAIVLGLYVAWNIGANDVANAMGTSVGSGSLTLKHAVIIAAILEFTGAYFFGSHVSETIESGIVNPELFANQPQILVFGMLASLLAAGIWLQVASYCGWPVSTTHSIIGAVVGFGIVVGGVEAIYWGELVSIVASWIVSPLMGAVISFITFNAIRRKILYAAHPIEAAKKMTPFLVFIVFFVLALVLLFKGFSNVNIEFSFFHSLLIAAVTGLIAMGISKMLVSRIPSAPLPTSDAPFQTPAAALELEKAIKHLYRVQAASQGETQEQVEKILRHTRLLSLEAKKHTNFEALEPVYRTVEKIFAYLQIMSACLMAFAHGANDVANAIGPLGSVVNILRTGVVVAKTTVPGWILALGGFGIVVGLATWGWRVIETVGKRITELTPTRGFSAEFSAALTIVLATRFGFPISTTHTLVGAVLGVGLARGIGAINLNTIRDIVISWIVTIPAGAMLSVIFFYVLKYAFSS